MRFRKILAAAVIASALALGGLSVAHASPGSDGQCDSGHPAGNCTPDRGNECSNGEHTNNPHCTTPSPTPSATATPTVTATPSVTPTATVTATPQPTETPAPSPSPTATATATATPPANPPGDDTPPSPGLLPGTACRITEYFALVTYSDTDGNVLTTTVRGVESATGILWVALPWHPFPRTQVDYCSKPAGPTATVTATPPSVVATPAPAVSVAPPSVVAVVPSATPEPNGPDSSLSGPQPIPPDAGNAGLLDSHDSGWGMALLLLTLTIGTISGSRLIKR